MLLKLSDSDSLHCMLCCAVQLFMAVLWVLHELLTMVMFWNLPALHLQEQLERIETNCENTQPANESDVEPVEADTEIAAGDCAISPAVLFMPQEPVHVMPSALPQTVCHTPSAEHQLDISDTSSVTMSNEFIEEAEEFMHAERDRSTAVTARESSVFDAETVRQLSWPCITISPISRTNSDSFLQRHRQYGSVKRGDFGRNILPMNDGTTDGQTGASGVSAVRDAEASQIVHEISSAAAESELPSSSLTWRYFCDGQFLSISLSVSHI